MCQASLPNLTKVPSFFTHNFVIITAIENTARIVRHVEKSLIEFFVSYNPWALITQLIKKSQLCDQDF